MSENADALSLNPLNLQELSPKGKINKFSKQLKTLIVPYWRSDEKLIAWTLLATVLALNMTGIYCVVLLNNWQGNFYNALQTLDKDKFTYLLLQFFAIVMSYMTLLVTESFMRAYLAFRWRMWLTRKMIGEWLHNGTFCRLFTHKAKTENPDQRISQDLDTFTSNTLSLSLSIITQFVKSITFAYILWTLSSALTLPLPGGKSLQIPGYMLWLTLIYVTISSFVIYKAGRPLVKLDYAQEKVEADFRFSLMRIRERRDEVSALNGSAAEDKFLQQNLSAVIKNYKQIIKRNIYVNSFQYLFMNMTTVLPILAAAPMFFAGAITLGVLMQIGSAFNQVEGALMIFVTNFQAFASWKATFNRIIDFRAEMSSLSKILKENQSDLAINTSTNDNLHIRDLRLELPNSQNLANFDFEIKPQERVLIMGPSGFGKSTLLKCIAGHWPFAKGNITKPENIILIPQKPYFPICTLRNSILYPNLDSAISDVEIQRVLEVCKLESLKGRLDEVHDWQSILSLGEQQRLNFVRLILSKAKWVILDEPTASMDKALEAHLFATLFKELPNLTLLTIGHSITLRDLHTRCIEL